MTTHDVGYLDAPFSLNEREHRYGERVHIISDPVGTTLLSRLCSPSARQPQINALVRRLYERLLVAVVNQEFPRRVRSLTTRMAAASERARYEAEVIDVTTPVVTVDIARAGIVPSLVCYELLNELMDPESVRQDHLMVSRSVGDDEHVEGARITGGKIGGPINDRIVLFPDPMGATGSSLSAAIGYYKEEFGGNPRALVTVNLIVTPEFIKKIRETHPEVIMYALRLDRGMSPADVLECVPGERWDEESGLNEKDYIIPGGGGFGEIMNNAWV